MSISKRLIDLRRNRKLTQQQMADLSELHVNQIRRYEAEQAQPSLDALKKIATTFNISLDELVFGKHERLPDKELLLKFEAVSQMSDEDKQVINALLDGMIVKHQTKQLVSGLSS